MNPTTQQPNPLPQQTQQPPPLLFPPPLPPPPLHQQQPPQSLQPHRPSTSCDRHPQEQFTGFCPSCLCERLAVLDPNGASSSSGARKSTSSSTATAALRAIFRPSVSTTRGNRPPPTSSSSFFPELRRTKSFSASKNNEGFSGAFEPQRKSCDVRVRSTLFSLFNQDDERKIPRKEEPQNLASSSAVQGPVTEEEEPDSVSLPEEEEDIVEEEEGEEYEENDDEIRVLEEPPNVALPNNVIEERVTEIVEEEPEPEPEPVPEPEIVVVDEEDFLKPMKEHIDLDSHAKKSSGRDFKEIAGSFWSAASVFSKKLQKWRQKQKLKKQRCRNGGSMGSTNTLLPVEKPIGRQFRETQSEIADYGFGRRSCDTDPRFSLDIGRMSFEAGRVSLDDPRYSFDEPRASWDGYLIGRTFPRMPTMLSVVEDAPVQVMRTDTQIPVEEPVIMNAITENDNEAKVPGGSLQTKEYYSDSSSRRRKSLDRSSSIRKTAAAVVAEMDELKPVSGVIPVANAKVTPAVVGAGASVDYLHHGQKAVFPDRDLRDRDSNSNSLRDDCSETFELGSRDGVGINGERKGSKKSFRWSKAWNIWGLINRRGGNKDDDEENRFSRGTSSNGVERSFSESWQDFRGERIGDARGGFNRNALRSNSSVSWRNAPGIGGIGGASFGTMRKSDVQSNGHGKKARDEVVLERNRSARYSPNNNIDNGLLRLYLTPMRGSRRNWPGKGRSNQAHSIARSVLRLY